LDHPEYVHFLFFSARVIIDVDECATSNGGCSANAECSNTNGGFSCSCRIGYTGDGYRCVGKIVILDQRCNGTRGHSAKL